jgi:hypothetical protein
LVGHFRVVQNGPGDIGIMSFPGVSGISYLRVAGDAPGLNFTQASHSRLGVLGWNHMGDMLLEIGEVPVKVGVEMHVQFILLSQLL